MSTTTGFILRNFFAVVAVILGNYLAVALPLAGRTPGEVSALYPTLFTPAGFTFSIWGIIYLTLTAFAIYHIRWFGKPTPPFMEKIGWLFVLSTLANVGWLVAFHHLQIALSMVVMLVLLWSLLNIYLRLDIGRGVVAGEVRWFVHLPFSIYLGWITVATIANTSIFLSDLGWNGAPLSPVFWTVFVLAAAISIGLWILWSRRDIAFALVLIWAFYGIYSKRIADTVMADAWIEGTALAGIGVLAVGIVYTLFTRAKA